jgi:hypothetical protein
MDNNSEGCQGLCAKLFALRGNYSWRQVPRQLGTQLQAAKPNEIQHFDFLYIWFSRDWKYQYLLLVKDDLSSYLWLEPCRTADTEATVDALMRWFAVFGVVLLWIGQWQCYALLRMRPLSISYAEGFLVLSCGKSNLTNMASATIDA